MSTDTVTFRLGQDLKAALAEIADAEKKPVGALLREMIRERLERKRQREFEIEARRQSLLLAEAARDPDSDDAAVLRALDANFNEFARELNARELAADKKRGRKWK
ncbi:MAG TPA: ribbon-helix-helix protein, CopG family [Stellaceae bacterium]|nr:ribbon-helix-helix protein, CopG family [Stellaceae bacterium]